MPRETFWLAPQDRIKVYVSIAALAGALVLIAAFVAVFAAFTYPTERTAPSRVLVGQVNDFEAGVPVTFASLSFHLVKLPDGTFKALYAVSPHLGCDVVWREQLEFNDEVGAFRDVCYGSTWDRYGGRLFGPTPRNMDEFPVEIKGDKVYVRAVEELLLRGDRP